MSKGIIVVDIPKYCDYCPAGSFESGVECLVAPEGHCVLSYGFHIEKPDWCPIKPIPEKIESDSRNAHEDFDYVCGWNACVDEILKGEIR